MFCLNYILLDLLLFYYIEKSHINCNITIVGTYFVWFLSVQIKKLCYNNNEISYRGVMNMDNPTEVLTIQKTELPNQQSLFNASPEMIWNLYEEVKKAIADLEKLIVVEGADEDE